MWSYTRQAMLEALYMHDRTQGESSWDDESFKCKKKAPEPPSHEICTWKELIGITNGRIIGRLRFHDACVAQTRWWGVAAFTGWLVLQYVTAVECSGTGV